MILPKHKCGLYLEHNAHRDNYQSVAEWLKDYEDVGSPPDWESDEAMQRAIATDEVWKLQWYPDTPIGSHTIAAPTLDELLAFAQRMDRELAK